MNRQEAARIVAVINAACPSQSARLDKDRVANMIDTYATLLEDLDYEQCNAAVRVLLQTQTWMPSVAEIRKAVVELERGPVRPGGDAWGEVKRAIGRWGSYRSPGKDFHFDDPVTAKCVAALSWPTLCLSENDTADRARFIELYDKFAAQEHREALSPLLGAAHEQRRLAEVAKRVERMVDQESDRAAMNPFGLAFNNLLGKGEGEPS